MVRPAGLLGAARLALRVALRAIAAAAASSNPRLSVVGSNFPPIDDLSRLTSFGFFLKNGAPGGITRRCAPRPTGRPAGDRRRCGVVEPSFVCRGFEFPSDRRFESSNIVWIF